MPAPGTLHSPRRVLWVEGKDDSAVVQSLCHGHAVPQVFRVVDRAGIDGILRGLPVEIRATGVDRLGIVVDANGDPAGRWAAIRDILRSTGYPDVPDRPLPNGIVISGVPKLPRFGAWIMPDNSGPGMLEDFAASLVPADDFLWAYATEVIDGIPEEHRRFSAVHRSKAHMHTWLAWQEGPGSPMGQAITKGDLRADALAARQFVAWIRRLMIDDLPPAADAAD